MNESRYQVLQILGQSRWVCTCRALDRSQTPPRACVIKQVKISSAHSPHDLLKIHQTVQDRCAAIQHPQIPAWIDSFVDLTSEPPCLYWVQDYIAGESLADLRQQAGVSSRDIWEILASILPLLQHLHQHQVIHGDIKPENLIYPAIYPAIDRAIDPASAQRQDLVLVDCALPNLDLPNLDLPNLDLPSGDPAYAAPEQLRGQATFASDLYSLGLTCLHLLTGLRPITLAGLEQWPDFCGTELPNSLVVFLNGLTAADPARRYASATAAIAALERLRGQKLKPAPAASSVRAAPRWHCTAILTGHQGLFARVNAVAVSPDSARLASASDDQTVRLWRMAGPESGPESGPEAGPESAAAGQLVGHQGFVRAVAFHPSEPWLASGSQDRTIRIWDCQTQQLVQVLSGHDHAVNAVAFSPDGQLLASGSSDKSIKLWQPQGQGGDCAATLKGHRLVVNAIAFGQNQQGQLILVSGSSDGTLRFWDLATQSCRQVLTEHRQAVRTVAVSPAWIASGGEDRVIHLWNWTGELCRTLPGHSWTVTGLAFAPDGKTLVSASWDKTLKLWQVETGVELAVLTGHTDSVWGCCFSPTGEVISASQDRTLRLWQPN